MENGTGVTDESTLRVLCVEYHEVISIQMCKFVFLREYPTIVGLPTK